LLTARDGAEVPCLLSTSPVFDDEGDFIGALAMVTDLRERVRAEQERERLKTELHHAQKMESIGQLAGGVAHDFNNLLGVILNYADFVDERLEDQPDLKADVEQIRLAAERAASLTQQLLISSRRDVARPRAIDPVEVLTEAERLLQRTLGEGIDLETRLEAGVPAVLVDPAQLQQVLLNLVINGADAMEGSGRMTITVRSTGDAVSICVTDTGPGMSPEIAARIFEPFFTTKPAGKGSGLGLATAYGVIADAGGSIEVQTAPGEGTTFEIVLPATQHDVPVTAADDGGDIPRGQGETVLVVEDHDSVRSLTMRILEAHGYRVLEAGDPDAALALEAVHTGEIDLLVSDLVLPAMSGRQLADRVQTLIPRVQILFMSGYTDDVMARHGIAHDDVAFLPKPFTAAALLRRVRETLGEESR
jgi:CheY-like chemotaxis protein